MEKPSGTAYKLDRGGKTFRRNIANIRRWNGPLPLAGTQPAPTDDMEADIEAGEMVIARENSDTKVLDIAEVIEVDDIAVTIHCYGTTGKNQLTAKYTPVLTHTSKKTGRHSIILWKPRSNQVCKKWTWKICHADFDDLILARKMTLCKNGALSSQSKAKIKALPHGYRIKRFRTT